MQNYYIEVELDRLICRDTESLHSADRLALFGAVFTDAGESGFVLPAIQINSGQNVRIQDDYRVIFKGKSSTPQFGLVLFGYDIDANKTWIENREDIIKISSFIAKVVKLIPKVGAAIGKVLDEVNANVPPVIDQFVAWDKDDKLLDHHAVHEAPHVGLNNPVWQPLTIDFKREGALGYSSWDYSLKLNVKGSYAGQFDYEQPGEAHRVPRRNTTPEAWVGTWESPNIRAVISVSDVPGSLDVYLLDKTTGVTSGQNGVTIDRFTVVSVKANPLGNMAGLLDSPFTKQPPPDPTPSSGTDGDYLALPDKVTLEYYGVEGDPKALRPALRYRWPSTMPFFIGIAPENRRDEFLSLSLNVG
jgi:hypothetical protein